MTTTDRPHDDLTALGLGDRLAQATRPLREAATELRRQTNLDRQPPADTEQDRIRDWWAATAQNDAAGFVEKANDYGSLDLRIMGVAMEGLMAGTLRRTERFQEMSPEQRTLLGQEMAVAFYNLGKVARAFGAYADGRAPSDDTWHDNTTYPMMARLLREQGLWSGAAEDA